MDSIYIVAFVLIGIWMAVMSVGLTLVLKDVFFQLSMRRIGKKLRKEHAKKYGKG